MNKSNLLLFTLCLPLILFAQPVQFNLSNKASISMNGIDTLVYPFTGGINAPQFYKIELDGDGIKDLFIFDRVGNKVMTYLFKGGKYVYTPVYESQFPRLYSWVVFKDYDGDGKEDIFTEIDLKAKPEPNYYLQTNGIRAIKNVSTTPGKLAWKQDRNQLWQNGIFELPPSRIGASLDDVPAFEDIDNDGDIDILTMPFGGNVISFYQNMSKEMQYKSDSLVFEFRDECWGYMSYLVNLNGFSLGNKSNCLRTYKRGKHNATALTLFDADNDGDKDLLYGDFSFSNLVYLENGKANYSMKIDSITYQDTLFPKYSTPATISLFPAAYVLDVDNDGKRDMLVSTNADKETKNREQILYYKNTGTEAIPKFTYQNKPFLVDQIFDLGGSSFPTWVDIDADGDQDLIVATQGDYSLTGNINDRLFFFRNTGTAQKATYVLADSNFLQINNTTPKILHLIPSFGDLTGDGKLDLLIGDLYGKLHFYENTSEGANISFVKKSSDYFGIYGGNFAAPQLFDLNKDGKLDIILGRMNGSLAYFENKGTANVADFTASASIDSIGKISVALDMGSTEPYYFDGYSVPHVCDLDKDGRYEILIGSEQGRVFLYRNFEANANRIGEEIENLFSDDSSLGHSNLLFGKRSSVTTADIDGDGISEVLIGNARAGLRMYSAKINGIISSVKEHAIATPNWVLFPNPAQSFISVRTDKNCNNQVYEIYDIIGQLQLTGNLEAYETKINIAALPPGIYLLKGADGQGNLFASKFMIE